MDSFSFGHVQCLLIVMVCINQVSIKYQCNLEVLLCSVFRSQKQFRTLHVANFLLITFPRHKYCFLQVITMLSSLRFSLHNIYKVAANITACMLKFWVPVLTSELMSLIRINFGNFQSHPHQS